MINYEEATSIAKKYVDTVRVYPPMDLALMLEQTIEFEYGWVFFYQSEAYIKSNDIMDALGGIGALLVDKFSGDIYETGTAHPVEKYIADYIERKRKG
jgi:hypothetical protein